MDLLLDEWVDTRRRFIEDEQLGFARGIPGRSRPSAGCPWRAIGSGGGLELESFCEGRDGRPGGPAPEVAEVSEQFTHGEALVERKVTRKIADPPPDGDAVLSGVEPKQADPARIRTDQIEEEANGGRLSRTVEYRNPKTSPLGISSVTSVMPPPPR